jgi:hypothetical protein
VFVGHYGVSYAIKRVSPRTSLGTLFLSVQVLDVLFSILVLLGVEKLRIVPGFTQYNPYDLYYMPFSHSLAGAMAWSVVAGGVVWAAGARAGAPWIGAAVFSHFLLDVPMHTPDMPLLGNDSLKIGLGLWHHRNLSLAAELVALCAGYWIWRTAAPATARRRMDVFVAFLVALTVATPFFPPPADGTAFAYQALAGYVVLAAVAGWLDGRRGYASTSST